MRVGRFLALAIALLPTSAPAQALQGDIEKGEQVFRRCSVCHMIGENASPRIGPPLNGIVGSPIASQENFHYSDAAVAAREAGLVWTAEELDAFLEAPRAYLPGTAMNFVGLNDEQDRADVIAYLASFRSDGTTD